jgi:dTDP-4-amino-4,6-dideoxygalactose transaminase
MDNSIKKKLFLSPPHMGGKELLFIKEAFEDNYIAPFGKQVDAFEQEFAQVVGIPYTVAVSSGTAAMHLSLRCLGIEQDDIVMASSLTFIGSVSPIVYLNAIPIFIDSEISTWNLDIELFKEAINDLIIKGHIPKAVIPTDLYGQCIDIDKINEICAPYNIPVINDSCEALGSTYKGRSAGSGAQAAVYSFNGNKIITTSCGGMLASNDKEFVNYARYLSRQARELLPIYEHKTIGYNYGMSNILAAIGRGQLEELENRVTAKRRIYDYYHSNLKDIPGIELMPEAPNVRANRWLTVILINENLFGCDREKVRMTLEKYNIESRIVWKPMHLQPVFKLYSHYGGSISEYLYNKGLCLPSGTAMTRSDLDRILDIVINCQKIN